MVKRKDPREEAAVKKAKLVFDRILDVYTTPTFVEIVARVGGDTVTRRYYNDGSETDR